MTTTQTLGMVGAPDNGHSYPKFRNDRGVREIHVGTKEFECIGQSPPEDHPHVFLQMGDRDKVLCPYCSTLFRFDSGLAAFEASPAASLFRH
jgi:uncharacterized Zn-finger protein